MQNLLLSLVDIKLRSLGLESLRTCHHAPAQLPRCLGVPSSGSPGGRMPMGRKRAAPSRCLPRKEVRSSRTGTATLTTTSPHPPHLRRLRPPRVRRAASGRRLGWCDGRCVQGGNVFTARRADPRLPATPASRRRFAAAVELGLALRSAFSRGRNPLCRPL